MSIILGICETPLKDSDFLEEVLDERKELNTLFEDFCLEKSSKIIEAIFPKITYNVGIEETLDLLNRHSNKIKFIHFSGHYEEGALIFSDTYADAINGLFPKINECKNLVCVFLNGCTTQEAKEQLKDVPVVIISNEPIYDRFAKDFSIGFYTKLLNYISDNGNVSRGDNLDFITTIFNDALSDSIIKYQIMLDTDQRLLELLERKVADDQNSDLLKREYEKLDSYIKYRGRVSRENGNARENIYTVIIKKPKVKFEVDANAYESYSPSSILEITNLEVNPFGTLSSLYKIFPFIFKDNINKLATSTIKLSPERFLNQKVFLEKYLVFVKCLINSVWWKMKNQYGDDSFSKNIKEIKEHLFNIISEDFDKHHKFDYVNDAYDCSRSLKSIFEIVRKTEKRLIENNNYVSNLFSEIEALEESISQAVRLFFTPIEEISVVNDKEKLFYLCDKEINHIISNSSFLWNVRLRSVYDIKYYHYPFNRAEKKLVYNFSSYRFDEMFKAKPESSPRINLNELDNYHSTIELIKDDVSVLNLSPFIIDRNTLEDSDKTRIDFYYLNSFDPRKDNCYVSFENVGSTKKSIISIPEISTKNGEVEEHILAYYNFIRNDDK